jgi:hypothetical protein
MSGIYYARYRGRGKLIWKSLQTDRVSAAKLRLEDLLKEHRRQAQQENPVQPGQLLLCPFLLVIK